MANDLKELSTEELLGIVTAPEAQPRFDEAVAALVLRYKSVVYAQAFAAGGRQGVLADDIFQETFIRAFSWLKAHRGEPLHSFARLLRVFSHRAAVDLLRKEGGHDLPEAETLVHPDANLSLYVQQLLENLDERSARVLRLSYLEGRSAKEIAVILGITPGHARVLRYRALELIRAREVLDDYADQVDPL